MDTERTSDDETEVETETIADPPGAEVEVYAEALSVTDNGQVTIPHRLRDRYDIDHCDVVNIIVYGDETAFQATDIPVSASGRIRFPFRKRVLYEVDDGDEVDLRIQTTGMTFPAEEM